jgi:hypothetical protein
VQALFPQAALVASQRAFFFFDPAGFSEGGVLLGEAGEANGLDEGDEVHPVGWGGVRVKRVKGVGWGWN